MELHELKVVEGSRRVRSRVGHGAATGNGRTNGRGQRGQKARSGDKVKPGPEGGQLPLFRRLPKHGLTNINCRGYTIINLDQLNRFEDGAEVTSALLVESGVVKNEKSGIKVLGNGSLDEELTIKVHGFSASTAEVIGARSGAHEVV